MVFESPSTTGQRVIILPETWKGACHVATLRHPKTDRGAAFLFSEDYREVLELQSHKPSYGSWLLDQSVLSDGQLMIGTPIDVLFLVLPYLHRLHGKSATRSVPLEQLLEDDDFLDVKHLTKVNDLKCSIRDVADVKDAAGCLAVCLNMEKAMSWIDHKVTNLANHLHAKKFDVSLGSKSSSYVQSAALLDTSLRSYRMYAFGIVSEYLSGEMQALAAAHLGLTAYVGITNDDDEPLTKVPKLESEVLQPLEDYSANFKAAPAAKKLSVQEKKLAKVDKSGMKSITSFFAKKS